MKTCWKTSLSLVCSSAGGGGLCQLAFVICWAGPSPYVAVLIQVTFNGSLFTTYPPLVYRLPSPHHQDQQGDPQRLGCLRHLRFWLSWPGQSDPPCLSFGTWQLRPSASATGTQLEPSRYPRKGRLKTNALEYTGNYAKVNSEIFLKIFPSGIQFQNWRNLCCQLTRPKRIAAYSNF